jgi:hypothetical protein
MVLVLSLSLLGIIIVGWKTHRLLDGSRIAGLRQAQGKNTVKFELSCNFIAATACAI